MTSYLGWLGTRKKFGLKLVGLTIWVANRKFGGRSCFAKMAYRQSAANPAIGLAPLQFDPKPSEAAFSVVFSSNFDRKMPMK